MALFQNDESVTSASAICCEAEDESSSNRFLLQLQSKHNIPDRAVDLLFKFLYIYFLILGPFSQFMAIVASHFPSTLYCIKKTFLEAQYFTHFVVCRKCWKLYHFGECIFTSGTIKSSKECIFVQFPHHPYPSGRVSCKQKLLKSVKVSSGKTIFYPFRLYCYKSLQSSLQNLLLRPGFIENCERWKTRNTTGTICDVYEGRVWKDFLHVAGQPFLSYSYGLMLNIDWFQPFKFSIYSVGAIYLTVMNLPRSQRFKRPNVILLGIIPGPSEPAHDMNSLLLPLVKELKKLGDGVNMNVRNGSTCANVLVCCALLCCACDLPAGRKVCGFLRHSTSLGCSKCLNSFPRTVGTMNYSGFDRCTWTLRTAENHRHSVNLLTQCKTKTELAQKESQLGCRYSALIELPYFDPPRMLIVDPMHNLFWGSGKHMLHLWLNHSAISNRDFFNIQETVDSIMVLSVIGRIPHKILTGFSGFTADQFKNWIAIFSIPSLFGILTGEHLECWRDFVLVCRILCKHSLTTADIGLADAFSIRFCKRVQNLYGESAITPNMHLHAHMKECLLDYGPVYEFWLFSFECFNGILGNQPNNNRLIKPQLMQRFLDGNSSYAFQFPDEFSEEFKLLLKSQRNVTGSLSDTFTEFFDDLHYALPTKSLYSTFDSSDLNFLCILLGKVYSVSSSSVTTNSVFQSIAALLSTVKVWAILKLDRTHPLLAF